MRYFTFELWKQLQNPNDEEARNQWLLANAAYRKELAHLQSSFTKETYDAFSNNLFHDSKLINIEIENSNSLILHTQHKNKIVQLVCKKVECLKWVYQQTSNSMSSGHLFEWGYEEVFYSTPQLISLNVLFSSAAELKVTCAELMIK